MLVLCLASVSALRCRPSFDPPQKKAKTLHSFADWKPQGLPASAPPWWLKELPWNLCKAPRRSLDRPLRGMGKVVLSVYRTYIMPLGLQKHHFNQTIPIHRKSTFLAESYFCVENKTYRLAVFKKVRVLEHNTNDKKQYLLAEEKK